VNNYVKSVNNSPGQTEHLLRRQLAQARKEVSQSIAMRLVKIRSLPIRDTDAAVARILEYESRLTNPASGVGLECP
jgi:hypothetical protein